MTIADAFNEIAVAQGGTASTSGTIAGAIDALNDALAGSDQPSVQTIEGAVRLLGQHIGGGGGTTAHKVYFIDSEGGSWSDVITIYDWDEHQQIIKQGELAIPGQSTPITTEYFDANEGVLYSVQKAASPKISEVELVVLDAHNNTQIPYEVNNGVLRFVGLTSDVVAIITTA